mmetsp:Transcript_31706/g.71315  ORF Transcript_31706/g.71315 Transcript_31706/m.71315 type:complete len:105 (+) Transcript_31706:291-605(+)
MEAVDTAAALVAAPVAASAAVSVAAAAPVAAVAPVAASAAVAAPVAAAMEVAIAAASKVIKSSLFTYLDNCFQVSAYLPSSNQATLRSRTEHVYLYFISSCENL